MDKARPIFSRWQVKKKKKLAYMHGRVLQEMIY